MSVKYKDIRVGVAGTGFIGPAHVEALRRNAIHVAGLVEITPEKAELRARELGIDQAYPSFEAMLEDPRITAVHLATPNYLHYEQAKAALLAGKHVICEKPLATTAQESAELVHLAAEKQLVNAINFNQRFYPMSQQARSMVQTGELGELFFINGSYFQDWLLFPTDWNWRLDPRLGGSLRAVSDIGSHWLDLLTFITGLRIEIVFADFKTFLPVRRKPSEPVDTFTNQVSNDMSYLEQPISTEDFASIILHFEGGVHGTLTVSQVSAGRKNRMTYEIYGAKSGIAWDSECPNEMWIGHRDGPNQILLKDPALLSPEARAVASYPGGHTEGYPDTFKQFIKNVYEFIQAAGTNAKPNFPTFADGHYQMRLSEALLTSAREGRWVRLKE